MIYSARVVCGNRDSQHRGGGMAVGFASINGLVQTLTLEVNLASPALNAGSEPCSKQFVVDDG
jgi:hypothetical protein